MCVCFAGWARVSVYPDESSDVDVDVAAAR